MWCLRSKWRSLATYQGRRVLARARARLRSPSASVAQEPRFAGHGSGNQEPEGAWTSTVMASPWREPR
jgi:hypothetical protein